ncbi:MAG: 16S rRNA (cytidine(1402)-2'-O)-methyltransferase [Clostridia bacterium]|nr:16S rRNA (cytidine(1402)-2'-O)-methyltransferase [Clostridia bacterium]
MEELLIYDDTKNKIVDGTLYLVTTPIGNMADITYRAVKVLQEVTFVAAEDTRNTRKLLRYLGISKEVSSYHEHNKFSSGSEIVERLSKGQTCALVTDAGTPAISDPGEDLVRLCVKNNIQVTAVPGVSAVVTAVSLSALDTRRFVFEGFLPVQRSERKERLNAIKNEARTIVIYESPHKLIKTLEDLLRELGDRKISLCRELTKINEEIMRTTIKEACDYYTEHEPRGEYVLVIEGTATDENEDAFWKAMSVTEHINHYRDNGMNKKDAVKLVAQERGVPKSSVYNEYEKNNEGKHVAVFENLILRSDD